MTIFLYILQCIVGFGILNVWLLRFNKPTRYRGQHATTMKEEFAVYGLPAWSVFAIGATKVVLALGVLGGIVFPVLSRPSAAGLAILMVGALLMHARVSDSFLKYVPALLVFGFSTLIAVFT